MHLQYNHRLDAKPELADHVNMQGVKQVSDVTSGVLRRLFWFLVICGGLAFTAFNVMKQMQLFLSRPVNVHVDVKLGQTLPFPAVTVCNTNIAKRSVVDMYGLTQELTDTLRYDFQEDDSSTSVPSTSVNEYYMEFGHNAYDSILWCTWGKEACGHANFTHLVTDSGLCFTFNANGESFIRNSGRQYGLKLALWVGAEEFTRSRQKTEGEGFMITIHSADIPPVIAETGMAVSPGSQYLFGLEVQEMDAPDGLANCGRQELKYYPGNYSREACRKECFTDYILKACSCREAYMPGNARLCDADVIVNCIHPKTQEYLHSRRECESNCPETCSYNIFSLKTASGLRVTDEYLSMLANADGSSLAYWRRNFVSVEVYYSSMYYPYIRKQYSYPVLDLICNIGGALGLILGATIVSAVELCDFIVRRIRAYWSLKTRVTDCDTDPKLTKERLSRIMAAE
ncbi:acid-sensing ion channel 3-like [Haliotis rubra]|uniref:acid-sensing ion channel 3-like n=1 Tax=Haliotis rubra TaxID=36100 RepID=UPI001EE5DDE0|nr:acid-sensing ion channel 3-like [Haliotis rubra]